MNNFNFKKRNLFSGPHFLGTLLIVAGLFALVSLVIFENESFTERVIVLGMGAIILGLILSTSYGGTLIDFTEKRFKEYLSIIGYKFGEWTALPYISTAKVIS